MHAHLTSLMDHHEYLKSQNAILGELIEEGTENQVAVVASMASIKVAATFAATKGPMIARLTNHSMTARNSLLKSKLDSQNHTELSPHSERI